MLRTGRITKKEDLKNQNDTFFHIRKIVLCEHFGDIGFTDCVIGMEETVRGENRNHKSYS